MREIPERARASDVIARLRSSLPGKNLYDLARENSITITRNGKKNKGWVGQTIERAALLQTSSRQESDGFDFELKSTTLVPGSEGWEPRETIRITQLNPQSILEEEFECSALWHKLESLIFVGVHHESPLKCSAVYINTIDITDPELVREIRSFWNDVRELTAGGEIAFHPNLGRSDDYLQLRPTGDGKQSSLCPITGERFPARAFYGTKRLIRKILE